MDAETKSRAAQGVELSAAEIEALLFDAASAFGSAEERERFLGFACRDQPELLERIRRFCRVQAAADQFFDFEPQPNAIESVGSSVEESSGLGVELGRYRLIERIGAGGCGVVYLAEQQEPVRRKVALKMIRLGLESPASIARFEMERQALASMNHPHIARVLDAGANASGRPFFVMELIDGETITGYCDSRNLGIRDRIKLFVLVCQAIQHAHQKGVIHRDIKPTNVLVETHESRPVPKVIDFGIAQEGFPPCGGKAGDSDSGFMGTPEYISPEQATGDGEVDTRTDIYSLGMLLCELLAGSPHHLPHDLMERDSEAFRSIMLAARPLLPSALLEKRGPEERQEIARNRRMRMERLIALCQQELDWVVGKAVHQDPARRYQTANALAVDLLRWLHGEAINARPLSRRYRLAKLVRRNRLLYGAGALAFLGLLGGFSVATVLFLREKESRAAEARLRTQAEAAHRAETLARKSWEYRSRVSESAVRLRYNDQEGAEKIVEPIPIDETPPSLESTAVYKQLAEWHRIHGRTEQAEKRYFGMIHALSKIDRSHTDANSDLFLPAAAMLARSSDPEPYEALRRIAMDLYQDARNRIVAERILKACLLKPAPDAILKQAAKLANILDGDADLQTTDTLGRVRQTGWECFSIALFYHRKGYLDQAMSWANRSLECPDWEHRHIQSSKALLGLVWQQRGDTAKAMEYLTAVETAADDKLRHIVPNDPTGSDFWYDWANLKTLLEEAGWTERGFPRER